MDQYRAEARREAPKARERMARQMEEGHPASHCPGSEMAEERPFAVIEIVSSNRMRATLAEMEVAGRSENRP
jgi:hypothetical protein